MKLYILILEFKQKPPHYFFKTLPLNRGSQVFRNKEITKNPILANVNLDTIFCASLYIYYLYGCQNFLAFDLIYWPL